MRGKLAAILQADLPSLVGAHPIRAQPGEDFQILHFARIEPDPCVVAYGRCASHRPTAGGCHQRQSRYTLMKEACFGKFDLEVGYRDLGPIQKAAPTSSPSIASVWSSRLARDRQALDRHSSLTGRVSEVMVEGRFLRRKSGS